MDKRPNQVGVWHLTSMTRDIRHLYRNYHAVMKYTENLKSCRVQVPIFMYMEGSVLEVGLFFSLYPENTKGTYITQTKWPSWSRIWQLFPSSWFLATPFVTYYGHILHWWSTRRTFPFQHCSSRKQFFFCYKRPKKKSEPDSLCWMSHRKSWSMHLLEIQRE